MIASVTASSSVNSRVVDFGGSISRQALRPVASRTLLAFLVGLEVELEMNPRVERPVVFLWPVFEIDLGKHQTHGLRSRLRGAAALDHAAGDVVLHSCV